MKVDLAYLDRPHVLVTLAAVLLTLVAAVVAATDTGQVHFQATATILAGQAVLGLLYALWPSGGAWSYRRRVAGGLIALFSGLLVTPIVLFAAGLHSACACATSSSPAAAFPGADARMWQTLAAIGYPILLAVTTATLPRWLGALLHGDQS